MNEARLGQINRFPVKSMQGENLLSIPITDKGIPGDRAWAVKDEVRGGIRGAKAIHELMNFRATYLDAVDDHAPHGSPAAQITFPNGEQRSTSDEGINGQLSEALAHQVSLWPLQPASDLEHHRRGAPLLNDPEAEFRRVFARTDDEPLPDIASFPPDLMEYESPPGSYFDAFPILIATTGSLQLMREATPDVGMDMRRFRANLVVDLAPVDGQPAEFAWDGKRVQLGECVMKIEMACPRCIMTTLPFDNLEKQPSIMRTLVKKFGGNFGVYATIEQPGKVALGDTLKLLD